MVTVSLKRDGRWSLINKVEKVTLFVQVVSGEREHFRFHYLYFHCDVVVVVV